MSHTSKWTLWRERMITAVAVVAVVATALICAYVAGFNNNIKTQANAATEMAMDYDSPN